MNLVALPLLLVLCVAGCATTQLAPEQRKVRIVSEYHSMYSPNGPPSRLPDWQTPHSGVDFGGNAGEPVIAPADGVVVQKIGHSFVTCGNGLAIRHNVTSHLHPQARYTTYCHMQDVFVQPGKEVKRGELIGTLGDSGVAGNCMPRCPIVHMELSTVAWGHPKETPGETFDAVQSSAGCFDPNKTYPEDRLVLTYPVRCKD